MNDRDYIVELIWAILGGIALGPGLYAIIWWGLAL
jgi:hypothetical protein